MKTRILLITLAVLTVKTAMAQTNYTAAIADNSGTFISKYHYNQKTTYLLQAPNGIYTDVLGWQDGLGGIEPIYDDYSDWVGNPELFVTVWPTNSWPMNLPDGTNTASQDGFSDTNAAAPPTLTGEHSDYTEAMPDDTIERRTADTEMKLATGGPPGSTQKNLWQISAYATDQDTGQPIPPEQISIGRFGNLDTNGNLYVLLPDNDPPTVTPQAAGNNHNTFIVYGQKYTLVSQTAYPALTNTNRNRTALGVGEQVNLSFNPSPWFVFDWTTTAGSLSETPAPSAVFTAPSNATPSITVTATIRGSKSVTFPPFTVVEPQGIDHAKIIGTNSYPIGQIGAGMTNEIWIAPTDVSFYRVILSELPCYPMNITGYFTNVIIGSVQVGSATLGWDNSEVDRVFSGSVIPSYPIYPGGYDLYVTNYWHIGNSSASNYFTIFPSSTRILNSSGDSSISKYGITLTRETNDVSHSTQ